MSGKRVGARWTCGLGERQPQGPARGESLAAGTRCAVLLSTMLAESGAVSRVRHPILEPKDTGALTQGTHKDTGLIKTLSPDTRCRGPVLMIWGAVLRIPRPGLRVRERHHRLVTCARARHEDTGTPWCNPL